MVYTDPGGFVQQLKNMLLHHHLATPTIQLKAELGNLHMPKFCFLTTI